MKLRYVQFIFLILFTACSSPKAEPEHEEEEKETNSVTLTEAQVQQAGIASANVKKQVINTVLKVNGVVDVPPQNIVSVSFPLGGYLKTTQLLPGMHVNRGQVIGVIEDQGLVQLQQDYLMAVARLTYLQQEYDRQKELNVQKVSADKVYQQTVADFTAQKVMVKGLGEKLRLISIDPDKLQENKISRSVPLYSPINGFVSKVNVNIGKFVSPTDVLFELINPTDMHAALTIFEKDMPKVKVGQQVSVSFVDDPSREYDCEIILVTRNVDDNRSGIAHCHFETMPKNLLPGMFLNGSIRIANAEVTVVPDDAIVRFGGKQYVLHETGQRTYEMVEVETGTRDKGITEITSKALDLLDKPVVVKNAYAVLSSMKNSGEADHGH
jgi:cobalt-zinc-cadmium efflux system membrane fusion protein